MCDLTQRFEAYAADFELTFVDDDWSRLEQYFTDDAVYCANMKCAVPTSARRRSITSNVGKT
jgi:hypothetical protein